MDDYTPIIMLPILNIIRNFLVQHANEPLASEGINELSLNITEALEAFFKIDKNIKLIYSLR